MTADIECVGWPGSAPRQRLRVRWQTDDQGAWVAIGGPVDARSRFDLLQAIVGRYHRGVRQVTVDLSEVTNIDREAACTLRTSRRVLEAAGVELRLCNVPLAVKQVLESTTEVNAAR